MGDFNEFLNSMKDFRSGAEYALDRIERRMYYIPDKWKQKDDSGAIYAIIANIIKDIRSDLDIEKEEGDNGEQTTTSP